MAVVQHVDAGTLARGSVEGREEASVARIEKRACGKMLQNVTKRRRKYKE